MKIQRLAHLSDLHLRDTEKTAARAHALAEEIELDRIDHVVVTGDLTHRGRLGELRELWRAFGGLLAAGRVTLVPGNHDRMGDDIAARIARGRVWVERSPGLCIIACDSTAPHNRWLLTGQGELRWEDLALVDAALGDAEASDELVVIALHHHPHALPADGLTDHIAGAIGWPAADELVLGRELLELARGRCDLVLHGHRHVPFARTLWSEDPRPVRLFNAGSSTALGTFRVFAHIDGALVGEPRRVDAAAGPMAWEIAAGGEGGP